MSSRQVDSMRRLAKGGDVGAPSDAEQRGGCMASGCIHEWNAHYCAKRGGLHQHLFLCVDCVITYISAGWQIQATVECRNKGGC